MTAFGVVVRNHRRYGVRTSTSYPLVQFFMVNSQSDLPVATGLPLEGLRLWHS
jgi:hypothetical protein